jgi:hypothetical protein
MFQRTKIDGTTNNENSVDVTEIVKRPNKHFDR